MGLFNRRRTRRADNFINNNSAMVPRYYLPAGEKYKRVDGGFWKESPISASRKDSRGSVLCDREAVPDRRRREPYRDYKAPVPGIYGEAKPAGRIYCERDVEAVPGVPALKGRRVPAPGEISRWTAGGILAGPGTMGAADTLSGFSLLRNTDAGRVDQGNPCR